MAEKLRANMPITYTLLILEVNSKVMDQFVDENQRAAKDNGSACDIARVEIAQNARELAERSVSTNSQNITFLCWQTHLPQTLLLGD